MATSAASFRAPGQWCAVCGSPADPTLLREARWIPDEAAVRIARRRAGWQPPDGACPACVQQGLLETLLLKGENALHDSIQAVWPIDAQAAFGALPTPLRLHADPRFTSRGVTIALVDAGFFPHPDLVRPTNRIRAWADAGREEIESRRFDRAQNPRWTGWDARLDVQWHGLMTSTTAAGNGWLSHGLYRGLASDADLVLVQARNQHGDVDNLTIERALTWLAGVADELDIRVVSLSVGGDVDSSDWRDVDRSVNALVERGTVVVAAAGNDGVRRLVPPAASPGAITVGGLDDRNVFDHHERAIWHSNYGETDGHMVKPEVVAPSVWVVAPVLPGTAIAREALELFEHRAERMGAETDEIDARIRTLKLVTPHYQHVEGTSFAAPLASGVIACMVEANPDLTPRRIRELLMRAASLVPGAPSERQGAGAIDAGRAVTLALADRHSRRADYSASPVVRAGRVSFLLHDHSATTVEVLGGWNAWREPLAAVQVEPGLWEATLNAQPSGEYQYKFLLDGTRWLVDPANASRVTDDSGNWNSLLRV